MHAKSSRQIRLGDLRIGGGAPVMVQSMTNTDTRDAQATLAQIAELKARGCEAARVAVPDAPAVASLPEIVRGAGMPIIADIHFDWRLAIQSIEAGVAGLRINPGNIGAKTNVDRVVDAARANDAAMRIGVNSGSLEKRLLAEYGRPCPEALVQSALNHARMLEDRGFHNFKISLKSSSVTDTVAAYRRIRELCDHPLHVGVTEAGSLTRGAIKSSVALGILLHEGIGDTIRVSLTGPPQNEIDVAYEILRALGLRRRGPEIISCPTCGRTEIDLPALAAAVEAALAGSTEDIKVAVMGCVVNGPGEAREADIGLAGGRGKGIIFRKGKVVKSVTDESRILEVFLEELRLLLADRKNARRRCL